MNCFFQIDGLNFPVSKMSLGCWPIAGVTSVHVNEVDSKATIQAALDCGINSFDTAYGYGANGESEVLLGKVLKGTTDQVCVASKCGMELKSDGTKVFDCSAPNIIRQCEESLRRLGRDQIELYYLHAYDEKTSIEEVAEAFSKLKQDGKILAVGVCNLEPQQLSQFDQVCPISAVQDYFNALQQDDRQHVRNWCQTSGTAKLKPAFAAFWPLMKGLLAGKLKRDHVFHEKDSRKGYPMFQGQQWQRNQDFLEALSLIAKKYETNVAGLVLAWTMKKVDMVLCGAKRSSQIQSNYRHCFSLISNTISYDLACGEFETALNHRLSLEDT